VEKPRRFRISLDHAQGILESVETRNLQDRGPIGIDIESTLNSEHQGFVKIDVLPAQWIDTGWDQVLSVGQGMGECRQRENVGIVASH
jgi:hypothetical protein